MIHEITIGLVAHHRASNMVMVAVFVVLDSVRRSRAIPGPCGPQILSALVHAQRHFGVLKCPPAILQRPCKAPIADVHRPVCGALRLVWRKRRQHTLIIELCGCSCARWWPGRPDLKRNLWSRSRSRSRQRRRYRRRSGGRSHHRRRGGRGGGRSCTGWRRWRGAPEDHVGVASCERHRHRLEHGTDTGRQEVRHSTRRASPESRTRCWRRAGHLTWRW